MQSVSLASMPSPAPGRSRKTSPASPTPRRRPARPPASSSNRVAGWRRSCNRSKPRSAPSLQACGLAKERCETSGISASRHRPRRGAVFLDMTSAVLDL